MILIVSEPEVNPSTSKAGLMMLTTTTPTAANLASCGTSGFKFGLRFRDISASKVSHGRREVALSKPTAYQNQVVLIHCEIRCQSSDG